MCRHKPECKQKRVRTKTHIDTDAQTALQALFV